MDPEDKRSVGEQVKEVTDDRKCCARTPLLRGDPVVSERSVDEQVEATDSLNDKKCCTDCHTSKTPLWRGGPSGPKSLCNACGIKYNKKRRAQMNGFDKNGRRSSSKVVKQNEDLNLKMRLTVINQKNPHHQQLRQRKRSSYERGKPWWNKLREEEQAAILLMAISCGGSMYS